jgi:hypothetical protein
MFDLKNYYAQNFSFTVKLMCIFELSFLGPVPNFWMPYKNIKSGPLIKKIL